MCLINVAHEHLTTQTAKKSKTAHVNVIGPGAEGPRGREPRADIWGRGPRAKKNKYPSRDAIRKVDFLELSVKQIVMQSSPISMGHMCGLCITKN